MKIYIAHATSFDFQNELYNPIKSSSVYKEHTVVLPHDNDSKGLFNSKEFFQKECELVIAEVSYPSIGVGIELGLANILNVPIVCIYKSGASVSGSIKAITDTVIEYSDKEELILKINQIIKTKI